MNFLIESAHAQEAGAAAAPGGFGLMNLVFLAVLFGAFYFMLIRPQAKRAKEHKQMLAQLAKGDEVVTSGGVVGRIDSLGEAFVGVQIADDVVVRVQKQSISQVLPKGTLKSA